ncbi:LCP family protein [Camelliibacillus cellulosilyticus]|uniref:LCP family protein n=1 Tax=Camelliibacillus cellulosilyticus TaxID=2174486 RepID=A0ABV9GM46_9BACL
MVRTLKKTLIIVGIVLGVIVIGVGGYAYYLYHMAQKTAEKIYEPPKKGEKHIPVSKPGDDGNKRPLSFLLMGVDQRKGDVGRSDTLIVATLNPKNNSMKMVSIPRDTRVNIPADGPHGGIHKINAAYAYGGPELAIETVKSFLDIPIDYYVRINMEGFADLVDAVGGVTVYNNGTAWHDEGFYKKGYYYAKGKLDLDGPKALGYVRMRHFDSDFGRNERQREVIQAIVNKAANFSSLTRYDNILNAVGNNVKTDLTFSDMKDLVSDYRDARNHITSYEMKGDGRMIDKTYYFVVSDAEKQKVHDMIMKELKS